MRKFLVYQITSRRNYDVAEVIHSKDQLSKLVTDFYNLPNNKFDKLLRAIYPRFYVFFSKYRNANISDNLISRDLISGIIYRCCLKFLDKTKHNIGIRWSSRLLNRTSRTVKSFNAIYGFDTCSLEIFNENYVKKYLVLEQCVAPRNSQIKMYRTLGKKYDVNFDQHVLNCKNFQKVEEKEWELADKIVCPSNYVRQELIREGVVAAKIDVVPYGFSNRIETKRIDLKISNCEIKKEFDVLFVGHEALRKGVLDIMAVADKFTSDSHIKFHFVGKIQDELKEFNIQEYPKNVIFHGKLGKLELEELYLQTDLFFLPSYLEGSALVIYEALSFGVPILTTYESGSVVKNNEDGFIVRVGDIEEMYAKISLLMAQRSVLKQMSIAAHKSSSEHTIDKYNLRLINAINS